MALRYAILGLLVDRPRSGYDLARGFTEVVGAYAWDAKHSQIYPELRRLDQEGLVEVVDRGPRGRTTYRCTDEGLAALRGWVVAAPTSAGGVKNEHVLRLFLLATLEREEALDLLRQTEERAAGQVHHLETEFTDLQQHTGSAFGGPLGLTVQLGIHSFRATQEWARWAREQIEGDAELAATSPWG